MVNASVFAISIRHEQLGTAALKEKKEHFLHARLFLCSTSVSTCSVYCLCFFFFKNIYIDILVIFVLNHKYSCLGQLSCVDRVCVREGLDDRLGSVKARCGNSTQVKLSPGTASGK